MKNQSCLNKKVIVGLSGGVDSSVSALLLLKQGYSVEAIYMRNWDSFLNNETNYRNQESTCPQEEDYKIAKEVADQLGIKLHRVDFVQEYWNYVFQNFISEYKAGRTPNPDILCNKFIKFGSFMKIAKEKYKADFIATGHYAKLLYKDNKIFLSIPKDKNKDQTYFLCTLTNNQLKNTIFPLENLTKDEVRAIAKNNNLKNYDKKDSTGICFIGERNFREFLENYIPNLPGKIIDIKTKKQVGNHHGVMYYTIGQRRGLNIGGSEKPYFVVRKDINKKIIYVASQDETKYLNRVECSVENFNWINTLNSNTLTCKARFRHRQTLQNVDVIVDKNNISNLLIKLHKPIKGITPGQFCVLYLNDICLGGGVIK